MAKNDRQPLVKKKSASPVQQEPDLLVDTEAIHSPAPKFDFSNLLLFEDTSLTIQPGLSTDTMNDAYEQEADTTAERVMHMNDGITPSSSLMKEEKNCEEKRKDKEDEKIIDGDILHQTSVADENNDESINPVIADAGFVSSATGHPLDKSTRSFMERRFGVDFSKVRIHNNWEAHQSATAVNALAYTYKNNIVFGAGQYQPYTIHGKKLLAHELTHVVQQSGQQENGTFNISRGSVNYVQRKRTAGGFFANLGRGFLGIFNAEPDYSDADLLQYLKVIDEGQIEDDYDSDNKARFVVQRWLKNDPNFPLTKQRKLLLILELLSGSTLDEDENAILAILGKSSDEDVGFILGLIKPDTLKDKINGKEQKDLNTKLADLTARKVQIGSAPVNQGGVKRHDHLALIGDGTPAHPGLKVGEFQSYMSEQADWFTESTLTAADRDLLWKVLAFLQKGDHVSSALFEIYISELGAVLGTPDEVNVKAYTEGVNTATNTIRITSTHDNLARIIELGKGIIELASFLPALVLKICIKQAVFEKLVDDKLITEFHNYFVNFDPTIENPVELEKSDETVAYKKNPIPHLLKEGIAAYMVLKDWVHDLHTITPKTRKQLVTNVADKSGKHPVLLILMSGLDWNGAFLMADNIEDITLNRGIAAADAKFRNLVLLIQGATSLKDEITKLTFVADNYGQKVKGAAKRRLGQVVIAGHGQYDHVEQITPGTNPSTDKDEANVSYTSTNIKFGEVDHLSEDLIDEALQRMDPNDARIVFAGCLVGSHDVPVGTITSTATAAAEITASINANPNLRDQVLLRMAALKIKGKVEAANASTPFESFTISSKGKARLRHKDDKNIGGSKAAYVKTGMEPEGALRSALETWADPKLGPAWTTKEMKKHVAATTGNTEWYVCLTRTAFKIALPAAGHVDPVVINDLAHRVEPWLLSGWPDSGKTADLFGNVKPLEAPVLYPVMLSSNMMVFPHLRIIVEQAWMNVDITHEKDFLAALDTTSLMRDALTPYLNATQITPHLAGLMATIDPAKPGKGQLLLALSIAVKDGAAMPPQVKTLLANAVGNVKKSAFPPALNVGALLDGASELDILRDIGLAPDSPVVAGVIDDANLDTDDNKFNDIRVAVNPRVLKLKSSVIVRSLPHLEPSSKIVTTLFAGTDIRIVGISNGWTVIDLNGKPGFILFEFQPKLAINAPGDEYEQEADAMAEEVINDDSTGELANKLREKELYNPIAATSSALTSDLHSDGQPMDRGTRSFMEHRFGFDFGKVKIHDDARAHQSAKDLHALAYTHSSSIVFGVGQYQPQTHAGKKLLAHELTHVVQQQDGNTIRRAADLSGIDLQQEISADPETQSSEPSTDMSMAEETGQSPEQAKFIVEDKIVPGKGQMEKTQFLLILNDAVCKTVDRALNGTPYSSDNCPYIKAAFSKHKDDTPLYIERLIERYVPSAVSEANNAHHLVRLMQVHVKNAVHTWLKTKDLSTVPEDVREELYSSMKESKKPVGQAEENTSLPMFKAKEGGANATIAAHQLLEGLGNGQPMESGTKGKMENVFGSSFSDVEIHTDSHAASLASEMNARAFTVGKHIAFEQGEYMPGTFIGDALLAHELAHVQQQANAKQDLQSNDLSGYDNLENDADDTAVSVISELNFKKRNFFKDVGKKYLPRLKSGLRLQSCPGGKPEYDYVAKEQVKGTISQKISSAKDLHITGPAKQPIVTDSYVKFQLSYTDVPGVYATGTKRIPLYTVNGPWAITHPSNAVSVHDDDKSSIEFMPMKPGKYTVHVPVLITKGGAQYTLETFLEVATPEEFALAEQANVPMYDMTLFRARLQLELMKRQHFSETALINDSKTEPYITNSGPNPEGENSDPDRVYHLYSVHPTSKGKNFKWYVRGNIDWSKAYPKTGYRKAVPGEVAGDNPTMRSDIEFEKQKINGEYAWVNPSYLYTSVRGFRFFMSNSGTYTIVCEELNDDGTSTGRIANYVQVILPDAEYKQMKALEKHIGLVDKFTGKTKKGTEISLQAAYAHGATGNTMPLSMYLGRSAANDSEYVLLDLTPGMSQLEYNGSTVDSVLDDFNDDNKYPDGKLVIKIPQNKQGIKEQNWTFTTTGESLWDKFSSTSGWASLGLAAVGVVAGLIPGGQPIAAVCFIGAAGTGAMAAGFSLYDRLQQAEISATGIMLDSAMLVASIIGGVQAFRALKYGATVAVATQKGRMLLWAGYGTDTVAGVLFTINAYDQINKILDSDMPDGEKTSAIVKLIALLCLQHGILVVSVKNMLQARQRVSGIIGTSADTLSNDLIHLLNYMDDDALRAIAKMPSGEFTKILDLIKRNPEAVGRLLSYNKYANFAELEDALKKLENRITVPKAGLFDSIDKSKLPPGWKIAPDPPVVEKLADGTMKLHTDVTFTDKAGKIKEGYFIRIYDPVSKKLIMSHAFLQDLPSMIENTVPMVPGRGTPTVAYFSILQMKELGIVYSGLKEVKMSTVQNIETLLHLAWLKLKFPGVSENMLIEHTASVKYAETTVIQSGHQIVPGSFAVTGGKDITIGKLKQIFSGSADDLKLIESLKTRYGLDDAANVKWNIDITYQVNPVKP